jgi:hypothetical protein
MYGGTAVHPLSELKVPPKERPKEFYMVFGQLFTDNPTTSTMASPGEFDFTKFINDQPAQVPWTPFPRILEPRLRLTAPQHPSTINKMVHFQRRPQ